MYYVECFDVKIFDIPEKKKKRSPLGKIRKRQPLIRWM